MPAALAQQYGPSYFNRPQRFIINYSWDIPFGKHDGVLGKLLEGWNISGVTTIQDGAPMTFVDGGAGTALRHQRHGDHIRFRPRATVSWNDVRQHRDPWRHRIPLGRIQRRPGLFQPQRILPRAGDHAGRNDSNDPSRLSHLRHVVWQLRNWHFSGTRANSTLTSR